VTAGTEISFRWPPRIGAVEEARLLAARTIRAWSLTVIEEPAIAIIVELVANAVRHAKTDLILRLCHRSSKIRIEVADRDPSPPVLTEPAPLQEGGRGMVIVDLYSTAWGTTPTAYGKTVWAEIDLESAPVPSC
jgi:signal transduction histidine kinase